MALHSAVKQVANEHFIVAGKIYHWGRNSQGKREAHPGLMKDCSHKHSQKVNT